tara:strand:- start:439 stop:753 length:315 start_codon:yes stop_codon:yes gene_type:complete
MLVIHRKSTTMVISVNTLALLANSVKVPLRITTHACAEHSCAMLHWVRCFVFFPQKVRAAPHKQKQLVTVNSRQAKLLTRNPVYVAALNATRLALFVISSVVAH